MMQRQEISQAPKNAAKLLPWRFRSKAFRSKVTPSLDHAQVKGAGSTAYNGIYVQMQQTQALATRNGAPELVLMSKVKFVLLSDQSTFCLDHSTNTSIRFVLLACQRFSFAICSAVGFFASA